MGQIYKVVFIHFLINNLYPYPHTISSHSFNSFPHLSPSPSLTTFPLSHSQPLIPTHILSEDNLGRSKSSINTRLISSKRSRISSSSNLPFDSNEERVGVTCYREESTGYYGAEPCCLDDCCLSNLLVSSFQYRS